MSVGTAQFKDRLESCEGHFICAKRRLEETGCALGAADLHEETIKEISIKFSIIRDEFYNILLTVRKTRMIDSHTDEVFKFILSAIDQILSMLKNSHKQPEDVNYDYIDLTRRACRLVKLIFPSLEKWGGGAWVDLSDLLFYKM
jgi:hypothetical protein